MSDQSVESAAPAADPTPETPAVAAAEAPAPAPEDRWLAALAGSLSIDDVGDLVGEAINEIDARLQQEPDAAEQTSQVLAKRLSGLPTSDTWNAVMSSLKSSLGWNASYLVSWIAYDDTERRLTGVEKLAPARVTSFLRQLTGLHGPEIEVAISTSVNPADDWRRINKRVSYDQLSQSFTLSIRLSKLNGEDIVLEGPPDSILNLTRHLMIMLTSMGSVDVFSESALTPFRQQLEDLVSKFYPPPAPPDGAAPDAP